MTKFFKASDFEFNTNWAINVEPWKDSKIMFVDDVYKYPDKVYSYLSSIKQSELINLLEGLRMV